MNALQLLLIYMTGWLNRNQQLVIEYLQEEVQTLREQLGKKPRFTDDQRRRLAAKAHKLGRDRLRRVASIVRLFPQSSMATRPELRLIGGSLPQHQLGLNVLAVVMDETNFRLERDPTAAAHELFCKLRTRIAGRFQRIAGYNAGLSIVASSSGDESSFAEDLTKELQQRGLPGMEVVVRHSLYGIKPGCMHRGWWFPVVYGSNNLEPYVAKGFYSSNGEPIIGPPDSPAPGQICLISAILGMNLLRKRASRSDVSIPTRYSDETNPLLSPHCRHFWNLAVACHSLR